MTSRSELIEAMARASYEREGGNWTHHYLTEDDREAFCADMEAALATAEAMGWVMVPAEYVRTLEDRINATIARPARTASQVKP